MAAGGPYVFKQLLPPLEKHENQKALETWLSIVGGLDVKEKDRYGVYEDWVAMRLQYALNSKPFFVEIGDLMLAAASGGDDPTEEHPVVKELLDELPLRSLDIAWFLCFMTVATKHPSLTLSEASSRLMPFLGESYFGFPSDYESMFDTWMTEHGDKVDRVLVTAGISK